VLLYLPRCVFSTGGLKEFCKNYENLCENASSRICDVVTPVSDYTLTSTERCEPRPRGPPASAILPFLYLGSEEGAADEELIDRLSIKFVLNITEMCPNFFVHRKDMHYKQIKINDSYQEDIGQHFEEAIRFIGKIKNDYVKLNRLSSATCCLRFHALLSTIFSIGGNSLVVNLCPSLLCTTKNFYVTSW
jgi:hypothetical protein